MEVDKKEASPDQRFKEVPLQMCEGLGTKGELLRLRE